MILIKAIQDDLKDSLHAVAVVLCGYKDICDETHGPIIKALESSKKRKLICVPRGCLKTSLLVAYVVWLIIKDPNVRIMIESQTYTLAANIVREIKEIIMSKRFVEVFGDIRGSVWNEGEIIVGTRTRASKDPTVKAASIGTVLVGSHFDQILYDDMNSAENTNTPENAEKVIQHYKLNVSILEPDGSIVLLGTRYAASDLIAHIIANEIAPYDKSRDWKMIAGVA